MADAEDDLLAALRAFALSYPKDFDESWVGNRHSEFVAAKIETPRKLAAAVSVSGINDRLDTTGGAKLSLNTVLKLRRFLPGDNAYRCFELARKCVDKVKHQQASTTYTHRGKGYEDQDRPPELFDLASERWTLKVDCAGFIRNVFETISGGEISSCLSDRRFMRAKDWFRFFEEMVPSILDDGEYFGIWRRVPDIRVALPGDIIVYRQEGGGPGGCAFVKTDNLQNVLTHVRLAAIEDQDESPDAVHHLLEGESSDISKWVDPVLAKLKLIGISSVSQLRAKLQTGDLNEDLRARDQKPFNPDTLESFREACEATNENTGHIMFIAKPPRHSPHDRGDWLVAVYHSSSSCRPRGVGNGFKRFHQDSNGRWLNSTNTPTVIGRMC